MTSYEYLNSTKNTITNYVVFILTTRMNNKVFVILMGLLLINFILSQYVATLDTKHFADKLQTYNTIGQVISKVAIVFLIIGVILYLKEHHMKGKFTFSSFFIGKTTCIKGSF